MGVGRGQWVRGYNGRITSELWGEADVLFMNRQHEFTMQ